MPTQTGTASPVSGWFTVRPVGIPLFSMVAMSASMTLPCLHSSMNAASCGLLRAACVASGCSAATAQNVTPISVSARVVKTFSSRASPSSVYGKAMFTPSLRPIQLACMRRTRSGQPGSVSSASSSSGANCVIRM